MLVYLFTRGLIILIISVAMTFCKWSLDHGFEGLIYAALGIITNFIFIIFYQKWKTEKVEIWQWDTIYSTIFLVLYTAIVLVFFELKDHTAAIMGLLTIFAYIVVLTLFWMLRVGKQRR